MGKGDILKINVIIPALNEESTIGKVIKDFRKVKKINKIYVYDGNSSDKTAKIARKNGAKVLTQDGKGKGTAIREIFQKIDSDIYLLVDGDDTYPAERVNDILESVLKKKADMVVGNRINKKSDRGSLSFFHKVGNKIISRIISMAFGKRLKDVLSGYRAINRNLAKNIRLNSTGFEIETELTIKSLMEGYSIEEVPIRYKKRRKGSKSKLSSFGDGYLIFYTILSLMRDYKPLFFFSILTFIFFISGVFLGSIVVEEWLRTGIITKLPTAVLSALLVFISVQFFTIGVILDALNKKFR